MNDISATDWHAAAKAFEPRPHGIINGQPVQALSGETFHRYGWFIL